MVIRWKWTGVLILLPGLWLQPVSAEREVYRCVYPGGHVEFRGVPVLGIDCVLVERGSVLDPRAASIPDPERGSAAPLQDSMPDAVSAGNLRVQNCEIAQRNLSVLEGDDPVVSTGPDGKTVLMSDDERAAMLRQTRRDVEYWCEDP